MATKIEWTNETLNPIRARRRSTGRVGWHCVHVSPGCANCYSETMNKRLGTGLLFKPGHRKDVDLFLDEKMLTQPLRWRKPRMIFCCSMTDLFGKFMLDFWIDRIFAVMALCPHHTFQVLTKHPERMRGYVCSAEMSARIWNIADEIACQLNLGEGHPSAPYLDAGKRTAPWPLSNIWLGTSVEDQRRADLRLPDLMATPAAVRFVSYEPALGLVDWTRIPVEGCDGRNALTGEFYGVKAETLDRRTEFTMTVETKARIHWLIVGGESGHTGARPMNVSWARQARAQCAEAGTAFYMKQLGRTWYEDGASGGRRRIIPNHPKGGDPAEWPDDLRVRQFPTERAT